MVQHPQSQRGVLRAAGGGVTSSFQTTANDVGKLYEQVVRHTLESWGYRHVASNQYIDHGMEIDLVMRPPNTCADVWIECKILHRNNNLSHNRAETMSRAVEIGYMVHAMLPPSRRCDFWIVSNVEPKGLALTRLEAAKRANAVHGHLVIPLPGQAEVCPPHTDTLFAL
jgi:hypothetical protein